MILHLQRISHKAIVLAAISSCVFTVSTLASRSAQSQDWSQKVFPVKAHDFGTVAVAAKTEFRFPVHNPYSQPLHIQSVRASCGCTTPIIENQYVQPGETGAILARFNTGTFRGKRGATLTVVVDQPFYAETRLVVDGYIRSDMVFHPGEISFGRTTQGETASKTTKILYAGRSDWAVTDVVSNKSWLLPTFKQISRGSGRVDYEITVAIKEDAPQGFFQDEVTVVTNDRSMPRVPLRVSGQVESLLSISPQSIALGSVKPGQTISKRLVIRSQEPVMIDSIECEGWDVKFERPTAESTTFLLDVSFTPTEAAGSDRKPVVISTSGTKSVQAKALLTADVRSE
ncbi:secreted protein containing DUF1573 [Rhodopirellula maiorica SM1]|uniref:Secreted protein containing DUF1573 n=1 Tax=Rhodopirellula maiorica SM1 TaxID=1265738 RepID=M5S3S8_9BACT|nr:DUF1573 domain-containing protein [Rhodopirellula maiorica]EMI20829.1 secreted protein containing DUF1573 [Rhodopirellula maiorica SM1]